MEDCSTENPGQDDRLAETCHLRVGSVYVGKMSGRGYELVEMFTQQKVDICHLQETRWHKGLA